MGLMATEGVLDYLDLFPDDAALAKCVRRYGDWLLHSRWDHDGVMGWSYQHEFNGQTRYFDPYSSTWQELPSKGLWHQDTLGRLLLYCTLASGDPRYTDAWAESYAAEKKPESSDHIFTTSVDSLPWIQARLWNARPTRTGICVRPVHFGGRTPRSGDIITPSGPVTLQWGGDGRVGAVAGVEIES
jgi:hypothetical protein